MGKQQAPAPPSPQLTAQAQTQSNVDTALAQSRLNNVNQITPYGNLTYTSANDANGIPQYTATQTLSPKAQGIYEASMGTQQNLANLAQEQSGKIGQYLSNPIDFSQQKQYLEGLTSGALDKTWDRQQGRLDQQLANQGIKVGSDAYTRAMNDFGVTRSDAYNSANVANYNTALQSQMALADRPLNQLLAIAGQGQIQQPNFVNSPQTGVAGTDIAGITQNAYANQVNAVNQNNAQTGQMFGGLFSAGAALAPLFFSDETLKENIKPTGMKLAGVPVKSWDWKDGSGSGVGVIAQEAKKKHPETVVRDPASGKLAVNYGRLMQMGAR